MRRLVLYTLVMTAITAIGDDGRVVIIGPTAQVRQEQPEEQPKTAPPAKIVLSADRLDFTSPEDPIMLNVTFMNTSSNAFVICTNRIECQNSLLTVVTRPGVTPISIDTNWYAIPQYIVDYFHGDEEGYVTVAPGKSYTHQEPYFTGKHHRLRNLLDFAGGPWPPEAGDYIVRVYFWGAECPVFDAPPDVAERLLKARLASNPITITLTTE